MCVFDDVGELRGDAFLIDSDFLAGDLRATTDSSSSKLSTMV